MGPSPAVRPPRDPRVGLVLGERYRLVRKIGEGGMGDVYEAEHMLIGKAIAVKILHPTFATRPEVLRRFHREALAATELSHPHIVEVSDLGRAPDGCPYMVLELLRGHDLAVELEQVRRMPLGRIVRIARQVCSALAAAHDNGIVHRDLKPENIFLCADRSQPDYVKVLDFGISKFQGDLSGAVPMTITGTALGTPYFMSPEQVEGRRDVDGRTDIWALGVVMYHALTGTFPFDADSYPLLFVRICTADPVPIDAIRTDLPRDFANVIARMLARERSDRFRNLHDVHSALARFEHVDDEPRVRDPSELPKPPSVRPGALAIARAGSIIDPAVRAKIASEPPGPPTEEAKRLMDAGLDLPSGSPKPRSLEESIEQSARPERRVDKTPAGDAFAPSGSWLDRDSPVPSPKTPVELAPVRRPRRTTTPMRSGDEPAPTIPRAASIGGALLALAIGVGLAMRGLRTGVSIVYGAAPTSGLIRDGFALYCVLVAWVLATTERDARIGPVGKRLAVMIPFAVALTFAIDLVGPYVVR